MGRVYIIIHLQMCHILKGSFLIINHREHVSIIRAHQRYIAHTGATVYVQVYQNRENQ